MAITNAPLPVAPMSHPYCGPASMECVNETLPPAQRFTPNSVCNFSLPSGFSSSSFCPRSPPSTSTSIISSSLGEPALSPIVEESSFFLDHEYDSDARRSTRRSMRSGSRRLKKRAPRPPPPSIRSARSRSSEDPHAPISPISERSARSELSEISFSARTYRSGWTSSLCSDDTFDYLNDPHLPYWRLTIRRHLRRFRAFFSGTSGKHCTPSRSSGLSVRRFA
ncbi:hypothetical protein FA13DRAFT_1731484 [Coprinellus micaceus]|uniref:Uncharacterized protein n=1 Tax=Coprinellus micaceus TaxID=71717 RepID=A0A4Y7TFL2_COPMI|nr:hypothetical protein FA13DRAFT_1731484 [Coprinellus micaceus]